MKLDTKLVRIKVQRQHQDGSWKTVRLGQVKASFDPSEDPVLIEGLARSLWRFLVSSADDQRRAEAYRYADRDTKFRVVKTTVYQDRTHALKGYDGREIHTNEVLCEPRSFNEHQEMRTYL